MNGLTPQYLLDLIPVPVGICLAATQQMICMNLLVAIFVFLTRSILIQSYHGIIN